MKTLFFFKNMTKSAEEQLSEYFFEKISKFERLLSQHFAEDNVTLQVKGERFQKHSAFQVELTMKLPGQTLTSREASHAITKAVDFATDRLQAQLKKSMAQMRRSHRSLKIRSKMKMRIEEPVQKRA